MDGLTKNNRRERAREKGVELLIPAGGLETLKVAVDYGADAVYMGGSRFSLRAKADNFTMDEMKEAVEYAHSHQVKVYVTINIFAHNADIEGLKSYFTELKDVGVDAVLISDPGIFSLARELMPDMEIHISTQANNTNYLTYRFWHQMGVTRVVAARELSLRELKEIRQNIPDDLEIEAFVHGAMCISYSGRCLLSNYFTGRDANRGACTHPCRWKYSVSSRYEGVTEKLVENALDGAEDFAVTEENRPGEYLPVEEDERGTYIFNSKDLCMIEHIPELIDAGLASLKVEGRMKTSLYVAVTARTYREAIDDFLEDPELYYSKLEHYKDEIAACTMRDFTTGFYFGRPDSSDQIYGSNTYLQNAVYLGTVDDIDDGRIVISQKNKFLVGDEIEVMLFDGSNRTVKVEKIQDEDGTLMESAPHPKQKLFVTLDDISCVEKGMILRKRSKK